MKYGKTPTEIDSNCTEEEKQFKIYYILWDPYEAMILSARFMLNLCLLPATDKKTMPAQYNSTTIY